MLHLNTQGARGKLHLLGTMVMLCLFFFQNLAVLAQQMPATSYEFSENELVALAPKQGKKQDLKSLLKELEGEFDVRFYFDPTLLEGKKVSVNGNEQDLEVRLTSLLMPHQLVFKKLDETSYVIRKKDEQSELPKLRTKEPEKSAVLNKINRQQVASLSSSKILEQTVSGRVIDEESGEALPGITILEKGTSNGTVTNIEGEYSIEVDKGATLVFSSVGYITQEVVVGNRSVIDIALAQDFQQMEELIVVGYGTQRKKDVTGSVASIQSDEIQSIPVTSLDQTLQGRVAGVQVTQNSGAPGGGVSIRIRGGNSMLGGNEPLYVIDGFPVYNSDGTSTNPLALLNPGDIESIEILKDASATAIYGSRGANGVVLITTKRGKAGKGVVEVSAYTGTQQVTSVIDVMNARQFAILANEAHNNDGLTPPFTEAEIQSFSEGTDWFDEVLQTAPIRNVQLTASGGNEKTRYAISGNYFDQKGIIVGSGFTRGSFRANLDQDINDKFSLKTNLTISRSKNELARADGVATNNSVTGTALTFPPTLPVYENIEDRIYSSSDVYDFAPPSDNPVALTLEPLNDLISTRVLGNVRARYEFTNQLSLEVNLGGDYQQDYRDTYNPRTINAGSGGGSASISAIERTSYLNENLLRYQALIGTDHRYDVVAGFSWQTENNRLLNAGSTGYASDQLGIGDLSAGETVTPPNSNFRDWTLLSWIGRMNYAFKEKYLLTATFRADGSSKFGEGNKWGYFPSVAAGWLVSEEPFLADAGALSNLKLRSSWGITGNQEIGVYQSLALLSSYIYSFGGAQVIGFAPQGLSNPDLKWETTTQYNVGIDAGFLDSRINVTADYYLKRTEDLLALQQLPRSSGFESVLQNVGSIENSGIEFSLNASILQGDFNWNIGGNFSANRNEVTDLGGEEEFLGPRLDHQWGPGHLIRVGEPLAVFYGYETDGLFQLDDNIGESAQPTAQPGDLKYVDQDNDGDIDGDDRVVLGQPYPDFIYGFNTTLAYKGLSLNVFFQGVANAQLVNFNLKQIENGFGSGMNQTTRYLDRWTPDNPDAEFPRASLQGSTLFSDRTVQDGSFLRLRNIRLAYDFPLQNLGIEFLQSVQLYASAQNILTITDYYGFDPEVNVRQSNLAPGVDDTVYPRAKSYILGLSVRF